MKLTARDNPETIKRYGHVRKARGWNVRRCARRCPDTPHKCTLHDGHRGPHVAHGLLGRVVAVWDRGTQEPRAGEHRAGTSSSRPVAVAPRARRSPFPSNRSVGLSKPFWKYLVEREPIGELI